MQSVENKVEYIDKVVLKRRHKMDIKSYVLPLALIGPSTEEQIVEVIQKLQELKFGVERQDSQPGFPGTGYLRITWE